MTTAGPDVLVAEGTRTARAPARTRLALALLALGLAPLATACGSGAVTGAVLGAAVGAAIGSEYDEDDCYYDDCYYYKSGDPALTSSF